MELLVTRGANPAETSILLWPRLPANVVSKSLEVFTLQIIVELYRPRFLVTVVLNMGPSLPILRPPLNIRPLLVNFMFYDYAFNVTEGNPTPLTLNLHPATRPTTPVGMLFMIAPVVMLPAIMVFVVMIVPLLTAMFRRTAVPELT